MMDKQSLDERATVLCLRAARLRRDPRAVKNTRKDLLLTLALELADTLAEKCNENLSDCGSKHLASERALRIIERHGWPTSNQHNPTSDALDWLSAEADTAGQTFNKAAIDRQNAADEVPF